MARIYISSTYEDLTKEREAAAKAVRRLGHQTVCMEDYVAMWEFLPGDTDLFPMDTIKVLPTWNMKPPTQPGYPA